MTDEAGVLRSRWQISSQALRYGRAELLLDPGFRVPGRGVEEESGALGETTVVTNAQLLCVVYSEGARVRTIRRCLEGTTE